MAHIYLPTKPLPRSAGVKPVVFGGWQTPPTGGEETWLGFMGTRLSLALETPNLKLDPDGRLWTAALLDGLMEGVIVGCRFFQPGLKSRALKPPGGLVLVDGDGQSGSILNLKGFTPGAAVLRREFFSIVTAGRRCLHYARVQGIADANGRLAAQIAPMLRVQPSDGDVCEFGDPMIEGKLTAQDGGYTLIPAKVQSLSFTITEVR